jgi:hypothetical protein
VEALALTTRLFIGVTVDTFSEDSLHLKSSAKRERNWSLINNGQGQEAYPAWRKPFLFSPKSRHFAHIPNAAAEGVAPKWFANVGNSEPLFSPAGRHLAGLAPRGAECHLVLEPVVWLEAD